MTRDFGDKVFAGAAGYYAKYRPSYPLRLFEDIATAFDLDELGSLLDLGCGTGELAIPLAKFFEKVVAVDPDPDMLAVGRRKAEKEEITNISWQKGSSKELGVIKGPFRAVTMGRSFHWMDQEVVLKQLYELLEEGGGLAIIGNEMKKMRSLSPTKDQVIQKLIKKYLGPQRRAGDKIYSHPTKRYEDLLPESKFRDYKMRFYEIETFMNIDQVVGNLYSFSWANQNLFGNKLSEFETELRHELRALNPSGNFKDKVCFGLYTVVK